ncbi:tyrosine-type recombinase/integrase [Nonlabens ponticola]|uniref:Integrase n=1 Tax=Nonlabens ponticola TaxID=2496866 RepID=A0A3S9MWZ5_9FLAO|nr:tyrosine-type recombinase/integrase [Nonlabens ponticola]AZQ43649.1 integrase [Nonlabens ponticola]
MQESQFEKYLRLERQYSVHTVEAYSNDVAQFLDFVTENFETDAAQVNYPMVRSWLAVLLEQQVSNRSINRKMSSLKTYFKYLQLSGIVDSNVMNKHKSLKVNNNIQTPMSPDEIKSLLSQPIDETDFTAVRDRCVMELLYTAGLRRAELISLTIASIDHQKKQLIVNGKRNKQRLIPLLPSMLERINNYKVLRELHYSSSTVQELFITSKGKPIYPTLLYRIVTTQLKSISSKTKVSPHILRHTFATHLINNGAELNGVKELLGHASLASTQVYTHSSMEALKKVHALAHPRNNKKR